MTSGNLNLGPIVGNGRSAKIHLGNLESGLKIGHCNCQSIKPAPYSTKYDEFRDLIQGTSFDIVGVSETWLKPEVPNGAVAIDGYTFCRNDRPRDDGGAGGVGLYISKSIVYRKVFTHSHYKKCEILFIEISVDTSVILVGVVYLPNGNTDIFESTVSDLFERYNNIIIVGDFNNDLFDPLKAGRFRSVCNRMNLSILHNSVPTHIDVRHNTTTLLDYFLFNGQLHLNTKGQMQCPFLSSHHAFIYASFRLQVSSDNNLSKFIEYRNFSLVNVNDLALCVLEEDFSNFYTTTDIDLKTCMLDSLISKMLSFVPISRFKIKQRVECITSRDIIYSRSLRDIAYKGYIADPTPSKWRIFCKYRNRAKRTIRRIKKAIFIDCLKMQILRKCGII
ncbi:hypothetical protein CVS40_11978 [Lucilia cuprina]|nr:hypothetical protein CVS40_11978 [Lucilia cuprina]